MLVGLSNVAEVAEASAARESHVRPRLGGRAINTIGLVFIVLSVVLILSSLWHWRVWREERAFLRGKAETAISGAPSDSERIARLTTWVYHQQGFAKNQGFYLWPKLDATPTQIYQRGGDCEDKSKLLMVMLAEVGIDSTMAMLRPCRTCMPTHVVVAAESESGLIAADPVYNIMFPKPGGGYYTVQEMRADPSILPSRIAALTAEQGPGSKVSRYKLDIEGYDHVTSFNWDKNTALKATADMLTAMGIDPDLVDRPTFLDDPYLFFLVASGFGAAGCLTLGLMLRRFARPKRRVR